MINKGIVITKVLCSSLSLSFLLTGYAKSNTYSTAEIAEESQKANTFFETKFNENLERSPTYQTYLGIKKNYDKWDDLSDTYIKENLEITKKDLAELKSTVNSDLLNQQTKISYQLFIENAENEIADFKYRFHDYPLNQMNGMQSSTPAFLINYHHINSIADAKAYIARLNGIKLRFSQLIDGLKIREEKGIIPPKFVFKHVIRDSQNILNGSTLKDDFSKKVNALSNISDSEKTELINNAKQAIEKVVKPAYSNLIRYSKILEAKADDRDGVWKFVDGPAFYNNSLKRMTTTNLTAEEFHQIGLQEVERIHDEMREIMYKVGFKGDLNAFFQYMRNSKQFYYENNEADRTKYLKEATSLINNMKGRLDDFFLRTPKAEIIVKRVEAFREKSAGKAFYNRPAPDGSRPGIYYANLYRMENMPIYQMEALAYHEGVPGHHMQIAIAQELEGIPKFRKFGGYTAYIEGWGLYSEKLSKEMGLYENPYSDFGRLSMELWRACRLVVDTGIHWKKWSRQQGIDYYVANTPNAKNDAVKMVERHIVMPGQATAYKVGMMKILELRKYAKKQLGTNFNIREFHDIVLRNGAVPLNVLTNQIELWINRNAKGVQHSL